MFINPEIYYVMEKVAPYLILWIFIFQIYFVYNAIKGKKNYSSMLGELPGIPLTFMHSYLFVLSIILGDWWSVFLFFWWGPGFLICAGIVIYGRIKKVKINWRPVAQITAWACKVNYLVFMLIYWQLGYFLPIFVFSYWILSDQFNLAWFLKNADRTRRVFEDFWIFRVCYVLGLFVSLVLLSEHQIIFPSLLLLLGFFTLALWVLALIKLHKQGLFFVFPKICQDFLRNSIYLKRK